MTAHIETPWFAGLHRGKPAVFDRKVGAIVAQCGFVDEVNFKQVEATMEYIVTAANAHPLLEELADVLERYVDADGDDDDDDLYRTACAVLQKLEATNEAGMDAPEQKVRPKVDKSGYGCNPDDAYNANI